MSAVDEIQAAIVKLRALSAAWRTPWYIDADGAVNAPDVFEPNDEEMDHYISSEASDLIVTLHRTIDAQLHILHETVFQLSGSPDARGFIGNEFNLIMQLVHAINGTA